MSLPLRFQAEILGYLEKACQLIPDQSLTAECKEMVDSYYPILIGIIKGELVSTLGLFVQVLTCYRSRYRDLCGFVRVVKLIEYTPSFPFYSITAHEQVLPKSLRGL